MASPAAPSAEIIAAMDELGLLGWLPNTRVRVRVRRDGAPLRAEHGSSEIAFRRARRGSPVDAPQAVQTVGLVLAAAGATALAFTGRESPSGAASARPLAAVLATAAMVGLGALATFAAKAMRGRRTR